MIFACTLIAACKIEIPVPQGGHVTTLSGEYSCAAGTTCVIDVEDILFDETFSAVPAPGYEFKHWKKRKRGFCGDKVGACHLFTTTFAGKESLLSILASDMVFFLEPVFERIQDEQKRIGFEVLEIQSPHSIRAWISTDITSEEFDALEVPPSWLKNQPRESADCSPNSGRFIKSPDSTEDGDILEKEFFGFKWFHSATVVETGVPLDEEGLLSGAYVRKFHELTYEAGSCLILLISPEGDVYFRIGRDANRSSDVPTIPNLWRLEEYTTPEKIVIELFEENLVIRTDNEDSFQGPVPDLGLAR
jgi:hypothetical protein